MNASTISPAFNRLAWSNFAAQSAEQIALAATPLLAVLAFGAGPGETGLLQAAQTLPLLVLAIPAGILADRLSRRSLLAGGEAIRAASLAVLLWLLWQDALSVTALAILGFIGASGTVAFSVAAPAIVPALVPPGALARANGRIELARTTAFVGGPALGGALVGWLGGGSAFALATALSIGAAAMLAGIREPAAPARTAQDRDRRILGEAREGAAFVLGHALLRPVLATQIVFNGAFFVLQAIFVPYALERLALTPAEIGWTLATYGAGMLAGVALAPRIMAAIPFGAVIAIGPLSGLAASLAMIATLWTPSGPLAALSFFLMGVGPILWVIATMTLRQAVTPRRLMGRVSSVFLMATGARPIGALIGAFIGSRYGMDICLIVASLGFALQAVIILASPVPRLAAQPAMAG